MRRDVEHLLSFAGAPGLTWRELAAPRRALLPATGQVLALVSFEREIGRTAIARRLIRALARRGTRAMRSEHLPQAEARTDLIVIDEPGPPTPQLLASVDLAIVLIRPGALLEQQLPRAAHFLLCRFDARSDLAAARELEVRLGPRLLATRIHEDPFLDEPGSQVEADVAALARELRRRSNR